MFEGVKTLLLHKLTLRILYIVAAFSTSHSVAFLSSPEVQSTLEKAGLMVKVVNPQALEGWITGTLLVGGEFLFHFFHDKFVLPRVVPQQGGGVK